jgi:hypothetical protein
VATRIISANTTGTYTGDDTDVNDTQMKQYYPTTNYSTSAELEATKFGSGDHSHSLLYFDLSGIPAGSTITGATLGLYVVSRNSGTRTITLKALLRNWIEAQATWNIYSTGNNWTTGGALSDGNDRSSTTTASASISATGWATWSGAQLIADIQAIVGGTSNYGWHLERTDSQNDGRYDVFTSSAGDNGNRPYLSVTYTEGAGGNPWYYYAQQ